MEGTKPKEKVYSESEITARLAKDLPHWRYENGWIRRKYKTHGWKSTLMVINTIGHLAEAAWHHPDLKASYAWVEVLLSNHAAKGITDKDFELAAKRSKAPFNGSPARRRDRWKERRKRTSASPMLSMTIDQTNLSQR